MPQANRFYYHVTTYEAAKKIIDCGYIDPKKSQGKRAVSWYVSHSKVSWAMPHVCQRHGCQIEDLAVLTVKMPAGTMKRSNRRGIYGCAEKMPIIEMISAPMWLQREERYVKIPRTVRKPFDAYSTDE